MYLDRARSTFLPLMGIMVSACLAETDGPQNPPTPPASPPVSPPVDPKIPPVEASTKARLKFKGGVAYRNLLAQGLNLQLGEVCAELGLYDCVDQVHKVALLEVSPYKDGILEPLPDTTITTPNAVERIAIAACERRANADFQDLSQAVVFTGLQVADGALLEVDSPEVKAAIVALYVRLLQRLPLDTEVQHLKDMYLQMAEVGHPELAKRWGSVSCFAVATTMEALFY